MKKVIFALFCVCFNTAWSQPMIATSQAELDAMQVSSSMPDAGFFLRNDTALPVIEQIHDLSIFASMDTIGEIYMTLCRISDLSPLEGAVVHYLNISGDTLLADLEPIQEIVDLRTLTLRYNTNMSPINLEVSWNSFYQLELYQNSGMEEFILREKPNSGNDQKKHLIIEKNNDLQIFGYENDKGSRISMNVSDNTQLDSLHVSRAMYSVTPRTRGVEFNQNLRIITGFEGSGNTDLPLIQNYNLTDVCSLKPWYEEYSQLAPDAFQNIDVYQNGMGLNSPDEILALDCSYLATEELVSQDFLAVYPNPSSGVINLPADLRGEVQILNMTGQVVYQGQVEATIDLSALPSGIYLVQIENGKERLSSKIIIE